MCNQRAAPLTACRLYCKEVPHEIEFRHRAGLVVDALFSAARRLLLFAENTLKMHIEATDDEHKVCALIVDDRRGDDDGE